MYNKVNVQRHLEERECPNYGKVWTIWCKKRYPSSHRFKQFCKECRSVLSAWERKKIKRLKFPEIEKRYRDSKRSEFERGHIRHMLHNAKLRAEKKRLSI